MKKKLLIIYLAAVLFGLVGLGDPCNVWAENQSEIDKATEYLASQSPDPWITMALIAAGEANLNLDHLKTVNGSLATDYENTILALTTAGEDPETFGSVNFVSRLKDFYQNNQIGSSSYLNDDSWGILALISAGESSSSQIIQDSKNFILANQNPDGGWSYAVSGQDVISDTDDTAAAIMALLEAGISATDPVITKAVDYLELSQNSDGGFPFGGGWGSDSNASSDAWVISAIYSLGQNPYDWLKNDKNPIDNLKSLQKPDGSFDEGFPDSTAWAVIALSGKFYPIDRRSVLVDNNAGGGGVPMCDINASAGEHGLIFLSGLISAGFGSDELFTIIPDANYHVADVLVDNTSVGAVTSYTFNNITAGHTISASFAVNEEEIVVETNNIIDNPTQDVVVNENIIVEPDQVQQDIEQQEQEAIPQKEESTFIPTNVAQASLLTVVMNTLGGSWLVIITSVAFILTVLYFYKKGKIRKNVYVIIGIGIIIVGVWLIFSNNNFWQNDAGGSSTNQEAAEGKVILAIDSGEGDLNTFLTEFKEGMTAFSLLKEESDKLGFELRAKNYDMGIFIEKIGNAKNGQDGKYWLYYVNGEMPMISADKKELKERDKVEFKFEKASF